MIRHSATGIRRAWRPAKRIEGATSTERGIPPIGDGNSCVELEDILESDNTRKKKKGEVQDAPTRSLTVLYMHAHESPLPAYATASLA